MGGMGDIDSALESRLSQIFPVLEPEDVYRLRRFGELRNYADGEALFLTGEPGPGMFVILSGSVVVTRRDGLGHVSPYFELGQFQFLGEVGQLTGKPALADGHAKGPVETLLLPPEQLRTAIVAEAVLGELIMRALILRRVKLLESGSGGPILIGPASASLV
jgi:thioredoxin reductase (NADPH)